jgi:glycosyltransferase involved in cell wall biosynthesis
MKISVIVPYWNAEPWLGRCLESLHQQAGNFEFLIVNDGSTDGGESIAEEYAQTDSRFSLYRNERTKGVSGARNTGLDHATGEWLTFLDADDEMLPNAWQTFQKAIREDANIIQLSHKRKRESFERTAGSMEGRYTLPNIPDYWWGVWNKLIRAEFMKDIRYDEDLQYGEDGLFVLECFCHDGNLYHADRTLTTTRHMFENQQSLSHAKTAEDVMKQCHYYEEYMKRQSNPALKLVVAKEMIKLWERITKMLSTY